MSKYYAGIGSRKTPPQILSLMTDLATRLEKSKWILRSGGALGADSAFQLGISNPDNQQIYTTNSMHEEGNISDAWASVESYHPNPRALSSYVRQLMARNYFQVMGKRSRIPSKFVICWTDSYETDEQGLIKDASGGTGQAVRIAYDNDILVYNLKHKEHLGRILKFVDKVNS